MGNTQPGPETANIIPKYERGYRGFLSLSDRLAFKEARMSNQTGAMRGGVMRRLSVYLEVEIEPF